MSPEIITILMFAGILIGVFLGFPIAFTLTGLGFIFGYIGWGPSFFPLLASRAYSIMTNMPLIAIPLFIFMGSMLSSSGIAELAYDVMHRLFGKFRGGLALATIVICTLFAACTGIVGASVTTMGLVALPSMIERKYDKSLATGVVAAGGTLGILIPPSIMLILYGPLAGISVAKLFAAAFLPGFLLSALYIIYVIIRSNLNENLAPAVSGDYKKVTILEFTKALLPFTFLVLAVLGAIFFGVTAPTEAAGLGALGSIIVALGYRNLSFKKVYNACITTVKISAMVMFMAMGASVFTAVFFGIGGGNVVTQFISSIGLGANGSLALLLFIVFLLGMFIDWIGILLIVVPIFLPILKLYGFDPLWTGMLVMLIMQTSFLTPPFAYSLYYIKAIAPGGVTLNHIYKGAVPFIILQVIGVGLCILFPQIITWLPNLLMK